MTPVSEQLAECLAQCELISSNESLECQHGQTIEIDITLYEKNTARRLVHADCKTTESRCAMCYNER